MKYLNLRIRNVYQFKFTLYESSQKNGNLINYFSRNNLEQEFGYKGENTEITHNKQQGAAMHPNEEMKGK